MLDAAKAKDFASRWLEAANTHDLDKILSFYAPDAELVSPVVVSVMNEPRGVIRGHAALRDYFAKGFKAYPFMSLHLVDSGFGVNSIVARYVNHKGSRTLAYLELDRAGKIARNVTHYSE